MPISGRLSPVAVKAPSNANFRPVVAARDRQFCGNQKQGHSLELLGSQCSCRQLTNVSHCAVPDHNQNED
jgi:hypothetical protein